MGKIHNLLIAMVFVVVGGLSLSGCNTVEGLGQDTRALGSAITGASQKTRGY